MVLQGSRRKGYDAREDVEGVGVKLGVLRAGRQPARAEGRWQRP
jgi:hypothetical protein